MANRWLQTLEPRSGVDVSNLVVTSEEGIDTAYVSNIKDIFTNLSFVSLGPFDWQATGEVIDPVTPGTASTQVEVSDNLFGMVEVGDILAPTTPPVTQDWVFRWIVRSKDGTVNPKILSFDSQTLYTGEVSILKSFLATRSLGTFNASSSYAEDRLSIYGYLLTRETWDPDPTKGLPTQDANVYVNKDGLEGGNVIANRAKVGGTFGSTPGDHITIIGPTVDFDIVRLGTGSAILSDLDILIKDGTGLNIQAPEILLETFYNHDGPFTMELSTTALDGIAAYSAEDTVHFKGKVAVADTGMLKDNVTITGGAGSRLYAPQIMATTSLYGDKFFPKRAYPSSDGAGVIYTEGRTSTAFLVDRGDYDSIITGAEILLNPSYIGDAPSNKIYTVLAKGWPNIVLDIAVNIPFALNCHFKYSNNVAMDDSPLWLPGGDFDLNAAGTRPHVTVRSTGAGIWQKTAGFTMDFFPYIAGSAPLAENFLMQVNGSSISFTLLAPGEYLLQMSMSYEVKSGEHGNGIGIRMEYYGEPLSSEPPGAPAWRVIPETFAFANMQLATYGIERIGTLTYTGLLYEPQIMGASSELRPRIYGDITYNGPNLTVINSSLSMTKVV